jgi:hypothetical protein
MKSWVMHHRLQRSSENPLQIGGLSEKGSMRTACERRNARRDEKRMEEHLGIAEAREGRESFDNDSIII